MRILKSVMMLSALGAFASTPAFAVGTAAGTDIVNQASITYTPPAGTPVTESSNTLTTPVAEIVDVTVSAPIISPVSVQPGDNDEALAFDVENTGNGSNAFELFINSTLGGDDFDPTAATPSIFIDDPAGANPGVLDAGDTQYTAAVTLDADEVIRVFIVNDIPLGLSDGDLGFSELTATSDLANGGFPNGSAGDPSGPTVGNTENGTDVAQIYGTTLGTGASQGTYQVSTADVTFTKSASTLDPFGGAQPVPGAVITYTLSAVVTGGTVTDVFILDPVPANTTYNANSITIDDGGGPQALDDNPGGSDVGATGYDGSVVDILGTDNVRVDFPASTTAGTYVVTFEVTID